jgi:glycosyltransferase involved in cell wall biosynthesis
MSLRPPVFSVIIPTHNRCALVDRAIDSVLAGTSASNVQIIVADDASTDATAKVLGEKYGHDTRVELLRSAFNEGPSGARNRGLAAATGDFVVFLDSDDVLLPNALALSQAAFQQVPAMQFLTFEGDATSVGRRTVRQRIVRDVNPGWRAEGFDAKRLQCREFDVQEGAETSSQTLEFGDFFPAVVFGDLFWLSGMVIRRQAALAAGPFDTRYRNLEDWDFTSRLCLTGIGGYIDYIGFHRETGRTDQLSNGGSLWLRAVMHHHILVNLRATGLVESEASQRLLRRAQSAADYCLGHRLLERHHDHFGRAYLTRSLRHAYKPVKSLVWLLGGQQLARLPRHLSGP